MQIHHDTYLHPRKEKIEKRHLSASTYIGIEKVDQKHLETIYNLIWKAEKRLDVINIREWSEKYSASRWIEIKEEKKKQDAKMRKLQKWMKWFFIKLKRKTKYKIEISTNFPTTEKQRKIQCCFWFILHPFISDNSCPYHTHNANLNMPSNRCTLNMNDCLKSD